MWKTRSFAENKRVGKGIKNSWTGDSDMKEESLIHSCLISRVDKMIYVIYLHVY